MCGTTRQEDALAAVRFGVDALGFIFYPKSPRFISSENMARIVEKLPPLIDRVGVFVNAPMKELIAIAEVGLSYLQLHGDESASYCRELRQAFPSCGIIKAFRVTEKTRAVSFTPYDDCVDAYLLDTYVSGESGGTGKIFDWSIIEQLNLHQPIILAGGLTPENVQQAIEKVRPFAVDINSGIESEPGVKDHSRLLELMELVQQSAFL